jgi:hypothetical protein
MYENKREQLASPKVYHTRILRHFLKAMFILLLCLSAGAAGYWLLIPKFDWYDSFLNASMILSGMGPIIEPSIKLSEAAKVFASVYAIFSGIAFITTFGILIAPTAHRFFHKIHLESKDQEE